MFQRLVSHNNDLRKLVKKGYAIAFDANNYLVVRDIPYLDSKLALRHGAIVAKLEFVDANRVRQDNHQVFFAGSAPYGLDGKPIPNLGGGSHQLALSEASSDVKVERSFSNKPVQGGKFPDFFAKIESYVTVISGPAMELHNATPLTFRLVETASDDSVFHLRDTLSSLAEISDLSSKLAADVVAIIGVGGTGSYVLDFMSKTPVREIRLFDLDTYHVHNAFRSPGRMEFEELGNGKVDVLRARYESFRSGITAEREQVDRSTRGLLGVTFAFVCVDSGPSRAGVIEALTTAEIPFIDVGMGLRRRNGALNGMVRATFFRTARTSALLARQLVDVTGSDDDLYRTNIQTAELNALNACLAVIRYKQARGFYADEARHEHILFEVADMKVVGDNFSDDQD